MSTCRPTLAVVLLALVGTLPACTQAEQLAQDAMNGASTINADWSTNATGNRSMVGRRYTYVCPPNGQFATVWGSGPYTDDSSVCTAGVHAGAISRQSGGRVLIEMREGMSSYPASTRNGVETLSYPSWEGSFVVVR